MIAIATSASVARSWVAISRPRPEESTKATSAEVEHELARAVGQHAVEHGLQREGGGHVEVAGEAELDGVVAGGLVDA